MPQVAQKKAIKKNRRIGNPMFRSRTIRNRTDLLFCSYRRIRELPYSRRLFRIVPLEERSLLTVCPFHNVYGETTQACRGAIDENGQSVWFVSQTVYDSQGRTTFSVDSHVDGSTDPRLGYNIHMIHKAEYIRYTRPNHRNRSIQKRSSRCQCNGRIKSRFDRNRSLSNADHLQCQRPSLPVH